MRQSYYGKTKAQIQSIVLAERKKKAEEVRVWKRKIDSIILSPVFAQAKEEKARQGIRRQVRLERYGHV